MEHPTSRRDFFKYKLEFQKYQIIFSFTLAIFCGPFGLVDGVGQGKSGRECVLNSNSIFPPLVHFVSLCLFKLLFRVARDSLCP